ncbi:LacI family transcriptional regulator [Agromyces intestinalis]|uniref:LacI family transcriptional regulator n=1 Tax=Agromyces intestinalis TaxID=2592652 RepID=A0A5C1YI44_9MICO|nr:LacI family DNA-binding transcriptional regulator [Agromyces intestinalis]QEO15100.1 LacI family transcriptional regulator [Agromyces intestinalis]
MEKPHGTRAPTLDDVARVAGVSRATVSRALRDTRRVAPELKEIVGRAVAETGYVPNRAARSLASGRTGTVVVAISGTDASDVTGAEYDLFADPFFSRVIGGLLRTLRTLDAQSLLLLAESDADRANVLATVRQGVADGAVLVSTRANDPLPGAFADAGLPAVVFARPPGGAALSFVDVSNYDGGRLAAEHLVARGARHAALIAGPLDVPSAESRARGFLDAMTRHGQAFPHVAAGEFTLESGERAMAELLEADPAVDAVFASNDLMALGAIHALQAEGRRVPEDVAVVGFDDSVISTIARPTLTTVRQPIEEMAAEMARMLIDQVRDPDRAPTSVVFDPVLVTRGSA